MTLSEFLIDLAYDVGKLQAFLYDRENYVNSSGLSTGDKALLNSRNSENINAALVAENVDGMIRDDGGGHIKFSKKPAPRTKA